MRPDMDDYAEMDESKPAGGSRTMSWMVLALAVGGFAALAYYAYNSGANVVNADEMMVVEADATPIKEAPSAPDGAEFPNQDKTIYDVISPNGAAQTGEKLLPEPERPVTAASIEDSEDDLPSVAPAAVATAPVVAPATAPTTTTFVAEPKKPDTAKPLETQVAAAATTAALGAVVTAPVAKPAAVAPQVAKPVEKSFSAPEMVNEKPASKPVAAVNEKPKPVAKPKAEKASASGAYKVQLGAFKSEEEANAAWKKISGAHSAVLSGAPTIVKADVNGATFYRLRAGSYASADAAKAACATLGGQACFPTK